MDSTPTEEWRSGIERAKVKLETNVQETMVMLCNMSHQTSSQESTNSPCVQTAAPRPTAPCHEPRLSPPELFKGDCDPC